MREQKFVIDDYYLIKKNVFWMGTVVMIAVIGFMCYRIYFDCQGALTTQCGQGIFVDRNL